MNKKNLILIAAVFGMSTLANPVFAAEEVSTQAGTDPGGAIVSELPGMGLSESELGSSMEEQARGESTMKLESEPLKQASSPMSKETLIGKRIFNDSGADLGKVVDVYIDRDTNEIAYLIVRSGGLLGVGSKESAVPFRAVSQDAEGGLTLSMNDDTFKNAPEKTANMEDRTWGLRVHEFFGVAPYWEEESEYMVPEFEEGDLPGGQIIEE